MKIFYHYKKTVFGSTECATNHEFIVDFTLVHVWMMVRKKYRTKFLEAKQLETVISLNVNLKLIASALMLFFH
jgi:hypothetical protein